jgi:UPF0716 protein FxsA
VLVWLFVLFTVLPVVELWGLITIGRTIGALPTILGVVVVGAIGAGLAKHEGARVFRGWRAAITEGRVPEEGILEGALVLVGGVLLLTPGVVTDVMGLACLFRPTRRLIAARVRKKLEAKVADGSIHVQGFGFGFGTGRPASRGDATGRVVSSEDVPEKSGGDDQAPPSTLLH